MMIPKPIFQKDRGGGKVAAKRALQLVTGVGL